MREHVRTYKCDSPPANSIFSHSILFKMWLKMRHGGQLSPFQKTSRGSGWQCLLETKVCLKHLRRLPHLTCHQSHMLGLNWPACIPIWPEDPFSGCAWTSCSYSVCEIQDNTILTYPQISDDEPHCCKRLSAPKASLSDFSSLQVSCGHLR